MKTQSFFWISLAIAFAAGFTGLLVGMLSHDFPTNVSDRLEFARHLHAGGWLTAERLRVFGHILWNNCVFLGATYASGIPSAGTGGILILFIQGANAGKLLHPRRQGSNGLLPVLLVAPHGALELTAYALAVASLVSASLQGVAWLIGHRPLSDWQTSVIRLLRTNALVSASLLLLAAFVEVYVTPELSLWLAGLFRLN